MLTVNGDILAIYVEFVSGAITALLPLWSAVVGVFLAFAIANMLRHFILKMK